MTLDGDTLVDTEAPKSFDYAWYCSVKPNKQSIVDEMMKHLHFTLTDTIFSTFGDSLLRSEQNVACYQHEIL